MDKPLTQYISAYTVYLLLIVAGGLALFHAINGGFTSQPNLYCEREARQVLCVPVDSAY